jgi:steroid 5-alpha reductase family enzyme
MLHFLHDLAIHPDSDAKLEYSAFALACAALVNITAVLVSRRKSSLKLFDSASGLTVAFVCVFTLLLRGTYFPRQVIATTLVCAWGARLSFHLYTRGYQRTSDTANVISRILWCFVSSIPTVICNTLQDHRLQTTTVEKVGVAVAVSALAFEAIADVQKARWHASHPPELKPTKEGVEPPVCAAGVWNLTRHPNLFGECLFHWGIYLIVRPAEESVIITCPILLTLAILILPGGIVSQESDRNRKYAMFPSYASYRLRTPVFMPCHPEAYAVMRLLMPRPTNAVCCGFSIYEETV